MEVRPGYKLTEVGVIPEEWVVKPLGELASSIGYGSSAKSAQIGLVPVLRMGNLQDGKIDWTNLVYTSDSNEIEKYLLSKKDILFNRTNTIDLVGKSSIYTSDLPAIFAGYLIRVKVNQKQYSAEYLNYILNTSVARKYSLKVLSLAVGQANINGEKLKTYPIPIPPTLPEQAHIAEALSDVDDLINSLDQLIAKKRDIKQAAMQQLLTGKKRLPGFQDEWEMRELGDLFTFHGGYPASRDQLSSEGFCYLHYGDIHKSSKTFIDVKPEYHEIPKLNIDLKCITTGSLLKDGDVVFVDASEDDEGTSRHIVVINREKVPYISGLHTIVAKSKTDELTNEYKRYCFQTPAIKKQFLYYSAGTKVTGISKTNIPRLRLPVPTTNEQIAIAEILSDMDSELFTLEQRGNKTKLLKQAMMQELLTGRIRLV